MNKIVLRRANERGHVENEWLTSYHTFSFGEYHDPRYMHFSHLRVINEDYIGKDKGFKPHSHRDMEIMTYMISGELKHQDSMGNGSVIGSGEVQFMRAGSGVTHSEFNPSVLTTAHLLQIWIMPKNQGLAPAYAQKLYEPSEKKDKFCLLASGSEDDNVFTIAQDVKIYATILDKNSPCLEYAIKPESSIWIQVIAGSLTCNDLELVAGDGAGINGQTKFKFSTATDTEFLMFHFN